MLQANPDLDALFGPCGAETGIGAMPALERFAKDGFLNVSFLVERGRAHEFAAAVQQLARDHGEAYDFRLRGPLPPYSFAA
jgi:ABC-type sugar transport system substrate-binding protein